MSRIHRLLPVLALLSAPAGAQEMLQTAQGLSKPVYTESVTEVYRVETTHGVMYGEVVRPVVPEGVKVPVILTYSPYNILGSPANQAGSIADDGTASYYVPRGYARAVFDVVGTRESGGCYDYGGIRERETGKAVVDFLGSQAWANGKVGMIGGSYDGTTQYAAAIEQPEHLTTIVPQVAIDRWYDYAYGGGIRYFLNSENPTDEGFDTPAGFDFGFGFIPPLDVTATGYPGVLADRVNPCERLEHTQRGYEPDPVYDAFWQERDYRAQASRIQASVMIEGGWLDHNVKHWDSTRMFLALPENHPKRLIMGQWNHSASQFDDAQAIRHAWFDHWLLGLDTGVMALPRVDTQASDGVRRQHADWPPKGSTEVVAPLYSLVDLDPMAAGPLLWTDLNPGLTEEQIFEEGCRAGECALLLVGVAGTELRISGSPRLELHGVSDAASTHLTPVLFHLREDGSAPEIITRGFLNLRNRGGLDKSEALVPGEIWTATVEFWDVDAVVPKGHFIGVVLMSANAAWALPDTPGAATTLDRAASRLVLPVASGQFAPTLEAAAWFDVPAVAVREAPETRFGGALPLGLALFGLLALRRPRR